MKGSILPFHLPLNNYQLIVLGLPSLTPVDVSAIEEVLQVVDLPDRTKASGGQTECGEFTMTIPSHHAVEQAAMESWYAESRGPVSPTYKKPVTLLQKPIDGGVPRAYQLLGCFPTKRGLPELSMTNEGEMSVIEWTISYDDVMP